MKTGILFRHIPQPRCKRSTCSRATILTLTPPVLSRREASVRSYTLYASDPN